MCIRDRQTHRAAFDRLAACFRIAIGGDHDDWHVGPLRAHPRQHFEAAHARHIDVGQDQDQRWVPDFGGPGQCVGRRRSKLHRKAFGFQVTAELLAEQLFDIGLIIDDEYIDAQLVPPACCCAAAARGSVIMNSVNAPGIVSTSILPPCCFTTMSWLIDRPSPVPSPAGLVVKKGLNIFSLTSNGMPVPYRETGFRPDCRGVLWSRSASAQSSRRPPPCAWWRRKSRLKSD